MRKNLHKFPSRNLCILPIAFCGQLCYSIITERDYKKLLNMFNHKGMCQRVTGIIGLQKKYPQVILDLMKGEKRGDIVKALQEYLPKID